MAPSARRSQKNNKRNNTNKHQSAAIPVRYRSTLTSKQSTASTRLRGSDNLFVNYEGTTKAWDLGVEITAETITCESSPRLSTLGRAFQRARWHNLKITCETSFGTIAGGGVVLCFVQDPTDTPPEVAVDRIAWASAQKYNYHLQWSDTRTLNIKPAADLLYTSNGSSTPRLFSPGTVHLISKGGPGQIGAITIQFEWDVTLSEPSLEDPSQASGQDVVIGTALDLSVMDGHASVNAPTVDNVSGRYLHLSSPVQILSQNPTDLVTVNGFVHTGVAWRPVQHARDRTRVFGPMGENCTTDHDVEFRQCDCLVPAGTVLQVVKHLARLVPRTTKHYSKGQLITRVIPGEWTVETPPDPSAEAVTALVRLAGEVSLA